MSQPAIRSDEDVPRGPIHRLSVAQYREMARAGLLAPDDRVELLEGWLVQKTTKEPPHRIATRRTRVSLDAAVPPEWYVDSQEPIATTDSEPEPDVGVVRGRTEGYADSNPGAENVALVVEVADRTLVRDREVKARIYARASIPVYWILNVTEETPEVQSSPTGPALEPAYRDRTTYARGDTVPVFIGGAEVGRIAVRDLLP